MMRHFVAFSLLLFVLEISVEASWREKLKKLELCSVHTPRACKAHCLESNCRNGQCRVVELRREVAGYICVCEDCPGGQKQMRVI
ncbi:unnamed protein product [Cylicocyclus nassatus]|uniref:Uncharacterized protein n=1 Tax=Cylicocyclus nassatus TaxID=53992 RepID=A0AA36MEE4_CYLNA|nr:unnamed protein product [Cylicocyclus nassatus]